MPQNKAGQVTLIRPTNAPCCWLLRHESGRSILIQTDWDWPGIASNFGWQACKCGFTDGTVDCAHRTVEEMMAEASDVLWANEGESFEDPGYFAEEHPDDWL